MTAGNQEEREVDRFIIDKIESVPHLEALLLLWNSRPAKWSPQDLARRLYVEPSAARDLLQDLEREELILVNPGPAEQYYYEPKSEEKEKLIELVDVTYRKQVVRISTMIHSKASSAIRDFARAFRFTKGKE
jgi:DNA-binding MarR family transcriptional regulator